MIATMSYLAEAERLTDTEDLAHQLAETTGRCQATGLDPDVYRSLIVATVALGQRPKRGPAWANDMDLLVAIEDITIAVQILAAEVKWFGAQVEQAQAAAEQELVAAQEALRCAGNEPQAAAARSRIAAAHRTIADCAEALELLVDAAQRLALVLAKLLAVPDELGNTYAAAYETVCRGHRLPHDGRWLGGAA